RTKRDHESFLNSSCNFTNSLTSSLLSSPSRDFASSSSLRILSKTPYSFCFASTPNSCTWETFARQLGARWKRLSYQIARRCKVTKVYAHLQILRPNNLLGSMANRHFWGEPFVL